MSKELESAFLKLVDYTKLHSVNVQELAVLVAKIYGLNSADTEALKNAAKYHDIGKIFTPAEILLKQGKLTDKEFAIIKAHPVDGANLLKNLDQPQAYIDAALKHHEKLDGSGYPYKLTAKELSLDIRIITVCDIYDALASARPYKKPLMYKEIKDILFKDVADRKLDMDVVSKVLAAGKILKKEEIVRLYKDEKYMKYISPDVACDISDMIMKYGKVISPEEFKAMYKESGLMKDKGLAAPDFDTLDSIVKGISLAKNYYTHGIYGQGLGNKLHDIEM